MERSIGSPQTEDSEKKEEVRGKTKDPQKLKKKQICQPLFPSRKKARLYYT